MARPYQGAQRVEALADRLEAWRPFVLHRAVLARLPRVAQEAFEIWARYEDTARGRILRPRSAHARKDVEIMVMKARMMYAHPDD